MVVPYNSYWAASYAPDSTDAALHVLIDPTPRIQGLYPSEIVEDAATHLPARLEYRATGADDEVISFNYQVIQGYWVLAHFTFTATQHAIGMRFKIDHRRHVQRYRVSLRASGSASCRNADAISCAHLARRYRRISADARTLTMAMVPVAAVATRA